MSDRVTVQFRIGGRIPAHALEDLLDALATDGSEVTFDVPGGESSLENLAIQPGGCELSGTIYECDNANPRETVGVCEKWILAYHFAWGDGEDGPGESVGYMHSRAVVPSNGSGILTPLLGIGGEIARALHVGILHPGMSPDAIEQLLFPKEVYVRDFKVPNLELTVAEPTPWSKEFRERESQRAHMEGGQ